MKKIKSNKSKRDPQMGLAKTIKNFTDRNIRIGQKLVKSK